MSKIYRFRQIVNYYYDIEAETQEKARQKLEECDDLSECLVPATIEEHQQEFEFVETIG